MKIVYPSGSRWATISAAMWPPAPGLFSTTTDWPQTSCRRLPTRRAVVSVEPPGVNGTTTRTGLAGQSAPAAGDGPREGALAAAARPTKRRRLSIGALLREAMARLPQVVMFFRSVAIGSGKINAGRLVLLRV